MNPRSNRRTPIACCAGENDRGCRICGMMKLARTIGPAISCGKKLRFFADRASKKWPLRGSLKESGGACSVPCMSDGLSTLYQDLLHGSYDCVDRIVLNAYFRMGHSPGGFRVWWRALTGSDETLENAYLMRMAGRFSRRVRGYAKAHNIPVIDCSVGERKHDIAEAY